MRRAVALALLAGCAEPPSGAAPPADPCDADGDGYAPLACGGADCDDEDAATFPGALDPAPGAWLDEPVQGLAAWIAALVVDGRGRVSALAADYDLGGIARARRDGDGWATEVVAAGAPFAIDAATDASGRVHVAFADGAIVGYAVETEGAWATSTLAAGSPGPPSMGVAPDGRVAVAWADMANSLVEVATPGGGPPFAIDRWLDGGVHVAMDSEGATHVVYSGAEGLRHATDRSGRFEAATIAAPEECVYAVGAAFGPDGALRVACVRAWGEPDLSWLAPGAPAWEQGEIRGIRGIDAASISLAIDSAGVAHMAFATGDDAVGYATGAQGVWSVELFASRSSEPSLALDSRGAPLVLSLGSDGSGLRLSRRGGDGVDQDCDGVADR